MAVMGGATYLQGDSAGLALIKTLASGLYVVVTMGWGRTGKSFSKSDTESWPRLFIYRFFEALAFPAWFTVYAWKPGLPIDETLETFGIFFAINLGVMLLMAIPPRKHSAE
ncbi:hypothetical protein AB4Y96_17990 [Phyllobacterium sp. TAF24]|uniref:hypothetical protein n=1 Tax=unclassified Phyllobacterium TaxID=2638441 RepID=UPI0011146B44|nr:hypothetical protein [Phyllobacterium sp. OV277]